MNRIEENNYFSSIRVAQEKIEAGELRSLAKFFCKLPFTYGTGSGVT